jgi:hypothetical protein
VGPLRASLMPGVEASLPCPTVVDLSAVVRARPARRANKRVDRPLRLARCPGAPGDARHATPQKGAPGSTVRMGAVAARDEMEPEPRATLGTCV